jgi:carboxymethylenebutenolidase
MKELDKNSVNPEIFDLYDDYAHNKLTRKEFVERLSFFAVGGLTLPTLLGFIQPNYEQAVLIKQDDPRLESDFVLYDSPKGGKEIRGLLSMPKDTGDKKLPGIIVVHENRGLNPYIEDVGRRAAVEGFISIAPDALWPLGGYPGNDDEGRTMQRKRDRNEMLEDFIAAYDYLKNHENCNGSIGVVGFCFGGWIANMMATRLPELKASVPFYGGQPSAEETAKIKASLMIQYAGLDTRVNAGWPAYEEALKANDIDYEAHIYPDVNHGFHNNSTPRYDEAAATLAWDRTIKFFTEKLV